MDNDEMDRIIDAVSEQERYYDEEFGAERATYAIIWYTDTPPPYPRTSVVTSGIHGYAAAESKLYSDYPPDADLMMCLESELEEPEKFPR